MVLYYNRSFLYSCIFLLRIYRFFVSVLLELINCVYFPINNNNNFSQQSYILIVIIKIHVSSRILPALAFCRPAVTPVSPLWINKTLSHRTKMILTKTRIHQGHVTSTINELYLMKQVGWSGVGPCSWHAP
jgi:hypothetical protein